MSGKLIVLTITLLLVLGSGKSTQSFKIDQGFLQEPRHHERNITNYAAESPGIPEPDNVPTECAGKILKNYFERCYPHRKDVARELHITEKELDCMIEGNIRVNNRKSWHFTAIVKCRVTLWDIESVGCNAFRRHSRFKDAIIQVRLENDGPCS